jgi:hypothetical protein
LVGTEQVHEHGGDIVEDGGIEGVDDGLTASFGSDKVGGFEDVEVMGEGALGDGESLCDIAGAHTLLLEELEDFAPSRVGEGVEDVLDPHGFNLMF